MTKDSWLQHEHHCRLCGAAIEKYDNCDYYLLYSYCAFKDCYACADCVVKALSGSLENKAIEKILQTKFYRQLVELVRQHGNFM